MEEADRLEFCVPEAEWVPDAAVTRCQMCTDSFTVTNRKHHCRRCGVVVCQRCSGHKIALPNVGNDQRVCKGCHAELTRYRDFKTSSSKELIANLACTDGSTGFLIFEDSNHAYLSDVWLSGNFLLLCWRDMDDALCSMPVHLLDSVKEGLETPKLKRRMKKTILCCVETEDADLVSKQHQILSLVFKDGRSLDMQAGNREERNLWAKRFRSVVECVVPVAQRYVDKCGPLDQKAEEKRESERVLRVEAESKGTLAAALRREARNQSQKMLRDVIKRKYESRRGARE